MKCAKVGQFVIFLTFLTSVCPSFTHAGTHAFAALATDDSGPTIKTLITTGAVWQYFDEGTDPGSTWYTSTFEALSWPSGPAQLGFGENDEATRVRPFQADGISQVVTHYFRHRFAVARAADFTNIVANVLRDDGVVAYLNGREVFRMNMPTGIVDRWTYASSTVGDTNESFYFPTNIEPALLVSGTNTLAVELHQTALSGDASFDLSLIGIGPPPDLRPVLSFLYTPGKIVLRWEGTDPVLEQTSLPAWNWAPVPEASSPYEIPSPAGSALFRLRIPGP
jgi:hypothetical protein